MDAAEQLKQGVREGRIDVDRLVELLVSSERRLQRMAEKDTHSFLVRWEKRRSAIPLLGDVHDVRRGCGGRGTLPAPTFTRPGRRGRAVAAPAIHTPGRRGHPALASHGAGPRGPARRRWPAGCTSGTPPAAIASTALKSSMPSPPSPFSLSIPWRRPDRPTVSSSPTPGS